MDKVREGVIPKFKVLLLGDMGVGKTSLFLRVRDGKFKDTQSVSLGADQCSCTVRAGGRTVELCLWDTAGAERFRTLTRNVYRNAHAVLLTFSVDDSSTLYNLSKWVKEANDYAPNALYFLVGNKNDLTCIVKPESVQSFANSFGCENACLTSAKTGQGVAEVLATMTDKLLKVHSQHRYNMENSWLGESIHVNSGHNGHRKSSSSCCGGGNS